MAGHLGTAAPVLDRRGRVAAGGRRRSDAPDTPVAADPAVAVGSEPTDNVTRLVPLPTVRRPRSLYVRAFKPTFDRIVGAAALMIAAIPMAIVASIIFATMGGPVLFRQRRVGLDGRTFEVLKFRTMQPCRRENELPVIHDRRRTHKSNADPRHTNVGRLLRKYSLDELPQLINVVRGEMSIVGPRPELESVVERYPNGLDQRHYVKPGLTGLWQISARGDGPMHEHGDWDLEYVRRVSLLTDLSIIARTPPAMLGERSGS